jgi:hypothetical protein
MPVAVLVLPVLGDFQGHCDRGTIRAMKKIFAATLLVMVFAAPAAFAAVHHHHHHHHHHRPA